jgi:MoxR-like ATPase
MSKISPITPEQFDEQARRFRDTFQRLANEMSHIIVGHDDVVRAILTCLVASGNVLLEGVPGIGKTLLVRTLAQVIDVGFSRIQFTPDLMPADIIGTQTVFDDEAGQRRFGFQKGPIFAAIVLADEINRATPKTQSALLEAMQEHTVTVGGVRHAMDEPFFVLATQNPLEMEGTYVLPEAQLDRFFFKLDVGYPGLDDLQEISARTTSETTPEVTQVTDGDTILEMRRVCRAVTIAHHVERWAARLVVATQPDSDLATPMVKRFVRYGASPRGLQALVLAGKIGALLASRSHVACDDIRPCAHAALRHRLILNFEGEAEGVAKDHIIDEILSTIHELEKEPAAAGT